MKRKRDSKKLWRNKLNKINTKIQNNITGKEKNQKRFSFFILWLFFVFLILIVWKIIIDLIFNYK